MANLLKGSSPRWLWWLALGTCLSGLFWAIEIYLIFPPQAGFFGDHSSCADRDKRDQHLRSCYRAASERAELWPKDTLDAAPAAPVGHMVPHPWIRWLAVSR